MPLALALLPVRRPQPLQEVAVPQLEETEPSPPPLPQPPPPLRPKPQQQQQQQQSQAQPEVPSQPLATSQPVSCSMTVQSQSQSQNQLQEVPEPGIEATKPVLPVPQQLPPAQFKPPPVPEKASAGVPEPFFPWLQHMAQLKAAKAAAAPAAQPAVPQHARGTAQVAANAADALPAAKGPTVKTPHSGAARAISAPVPGSRARDGSVADKRGSGSAEVAVGEHGKRQLAVAPQRPSTRHPSATEGPPAVARASLSETASLDSSTDSASCRLERFRGLALRLASSRSPTTSLQKTSTASPAIPSAASALRSAATAGARPAGETTRPAGLSVSATGASVSAGGVSDSAVGVSVSGTDAASVYATAPDAPAEIVPSLDTGGGSSRAPPIQGRSGGVRPRKGRRSRDSGWTGGVLGGSSGETPSSVTSVAAPPGQQPTVAAAKPLPLVPTVPPTAKAVARLLVTSAFSSATPPPGFPTSPVAGAAFASGMARHPSGEPALSPAASALLAPANSREHILSPAASALLAPANSRESISLTSQSRSLSTADSSLPDPASAAAERLASAVARAGEHHLPSSRFAAEASRTASLASARLSAQLPPPVVNTRSEHRLAPWVPDAWPFAAAPAGELVAAGGDVVAAAALTQVPAPTTSLSRQEPGGAAHGEPATSVDGSSTGGGSIADRLNQLRLSGLELSLAEDPSSAGGEAGSVPSQQPPVNLLQRDSAAAEANSVISGEAGVQRPRPGPLAWGGAGSDGGDVQSDSGAGTATGTGTGGRVSQSAVDFRLGAAAAAAAVAVNAAGKGG
mmetsp:Transcript_12654/g.38143  ORF Transcript_12654/g.38143 Transcript_12654/m.38143 type:complete len:799 (+) Transcript_12654:1067-3463(+)